jgi:hypothetical protein
VTGRLDSCPVEAHTRDVTTTNEAPLQKFHVTGIRENWYQAAPDAPRQLGGSCWHCGTGIAIEVVIEHEETGEIHTIGTTCAERVGLDPENLKKFLAEKFAEERAAAREISSKAYREARAAEEAAATVKFGEHGTESRFLSGCYCEECVKAAPHGQIVRFIAGGCRCLDCVDAVVAGGGYTVHEDRVVLVDVETGELVEDAREVDTKYGMKWRSDSRDVWLPWRPVRRSTLANKGFVEAEAPVLVEICGSRSRSWYKPVMVLGSPIVDTWGETIEVAR